jgi:hypothetical protein
MAERYATIIEDDDGNEVISNIALLEGRPEQPRTGKLVKVGDKVKIGMVKGGSLEAADGWGFPDGSGLAQFKANPPDKKPRTASKLKDVDA